MDRVRSRLLIGVVTACFALLAVFVWLGGLVSDDSRTPVATILGLAALCAGVGLVFDPTRSLPKSVLLMDELTVVRNADRRDSGTIIDTIDDVVVSNMGWSDEHRRDWTSATANIPSAASNIFVIARPEAQRALGVITLAVVDDPTLLKVGMWLGPEGRGQGHMRRALTLLTTRLGERGVSFIAETSIANVASCKSLEGAGFERIGSKTHRLPNGVDTDAAIYAKYTPDPATPVSAAERTER